MSRLNLIYARSRNGVIGRRNQLPWHLPQDLAHFKRTTLGCPVIMGRKTWDSIGRPLPGRRNIVVTRNAQWRAEGAQRAASLDEALALAADAPEIFVIGGGELYREALGRAQRVFVTEINVHVDDGDTLAPTLGPEWELVSCEDHHEPPAPDYGFLVYQKRPA